MATYSSVLQEYVAMINQYGGKMEGALGVSEEQLRKAAQSAVCKINIDSDGRLVITGVIRRELAKNPGNFDPRGYLKVARDELTTMIIKKNRHVLGSADKA
jgi:fructose-bisphosphate aldolase, class II